MTRRVREERERATSRRQSALWRGLTRQLMRDLSPSARLSLSSRGLAQLLRPNDLTCIVTFGLEIDGWCNGRRIPDWRMQCQLRRLRECLDALGDGIMRSDRYGFFNDPHPMLGKKRPVELLRTARGAARVLGLIQS